MEKVFSILSVFIIFFAFSCRYDDPVKDDGGDNNPDTNSTKETYHDFYPMRVGTEWEYTYLDQFESYGKFIYKIYANEVKDSDTIFKLQEYWSDKHEYIKKNEGVYYRNSVTDTFKLLYKYPALLNVEYEWGTQKITIKSIDTIINVPYGEFKCFLYSFESLDGSNNTYVNHYFIAKNIGIVKGVSYIKYQNENTYNLASVWGLFNYKY